MFRRVGTGVEAHKGPDGCASAAVSSGSVTLLSTNALCLGHPDNPGLWAFLGQTLIPRYIFNNNNYYYFIILFSLRQRFAL